MNTSILAKWPERRPEMKQRIVTIRRSQAMPVANFDRALQEGVKLTFKVRRSTHYGLFTFTQAGDVANVTASDGIFDFLPGTHSQDKDLCEIVDMVRNALDVKS
jgi:hypothetical protein